MQTTASFTSYAGTEHLHLQDIDSNFLSVFKRNFNQPAFVSTCSLAGPDTHLPRKAQTLHSAFVGAWINT